MVECIAIRVKATVRGNKQRAPLNWIEQLRRLLLLPQLLLQGVWLACALAVFLEAEQRGSV